MCDSQIRKNSEFSEQTVETAALSALFARCASPLNSTTAPSQPGSQDRCHELGFVNSHFRGVQMSENDSKRTLEAISVMFAGFEGHSRLQDLKKDLENAPSTVADSKFDREQREKGQRRKSVKMFSFHHQGYEATHRHTETSDIRQARLTTNTLKTQITEETKRH